MIKYKSITEKVTQQRRVRVVTELACDMCGAQASNPREYEWDETGDETIGIGVEGDNPDSMELCPQCCRWLMDEIRNGNIRRTT